MTAMTNEQWTGFLSEGTRTGKLATTRKDGRPHVMPIWFILDAGDIVFMTGAETIKGRSLARTGLACLCVDDDQPPYSFVTVTGPVAMSTDLEQMLPLSIRIAARYMGDELAVQYGKRNAVEGELLLRMKPEHVVAYRDIAD